MAEVNNEEKIYTTVPMAKYKRINNFEGNNQVRDGNFNLLIIK
jgi:hypothetical protein